MAKSSSSAGDTSDPIAMPGFLSGTASLAYSAGSVPSDDSTFTDCVEHTLEEQSLKGYANRAPLTPGYVARLPQDPGARVGARAELRVPSATRELEQRVQSSSASRKGSTSAKRSATDRPSCAERAVATSRATAPSTSRVMMRWSSTAAST